MRISTTAPPGDQHLGRDREILTPLLRSQLGGDRWGLQHDHQGQEAQGRHHVHHSAEAGGDLGRVLGAELGIEHAEGEGQGAGREGVEQDGAELTAIMNAPACSSQLVRTVITSAITSSGTVPVQYLLHSIAPGSSGLERSSHICRPSSETAGKMKRAATAASTKPARPRFRNEITMTRLKGIRSPEWIGSDLMLKM